MIYSVNPNIPKIHFSGTQQPINKTESIAKLPETKDAFVSADTINRKSSNKNDGNATPWIVSLIAFLGLWAASDWVVDRYFDKKYSRKNDDLFKNEAPLFNNNFEMPMLENIFKTPDEVIEKKIEIFSEHTGNTQGWVKLPTEEQKIWQEIENNVQNANPYLQPNQEKDLRLLGRLASEEKETKVSLDFTPAIMLQGESKENTKNALEQVKNLMGARLLTVEHKGNSKETYDSIMNIVKEDASKHFTEKNERTLLHIDNFEQFLKDGQENLSKQFEKILNYCYPSTTFIYKAASEENIPKNILAHKLTRFKIAVRP